MVAIRIRGSRALARRLRLGQLRDRVRASPSWIAVPARKIKDLDIGAALPTAAFAMTFDDGPDPRATPKLLTLLESHSAHATFFMCGSAARRHPDLVRAVADAGHSIGGHSWDHRLIRGLSEPEWRRQIDDTHHLLEDLTGRPVRWFRPPWGHTDRYTRETLRRRGVATVRWSAAGRDWSLRDPGLIARAVLDNLGPGSIVLLHDAIADSLGRNGAASVTQEPTVRATAILLSASRAHGLIPVGLDRLPRGRIPRIGRPQLIGKRRNPSPSALESHVE